MRYPVLTVNPNRNDFATIKIQGKVLASYVKTGSYLHKIAKTASTGCVTGEEQSQKNGEITVWEKVSLFYTPSNRMITAQYQGMTATLVLTPEAEKLVPPELLDRLKGRKRGHCQHYCYTRRW